jgi:hypothetical protein
MLALGVVSIATISCVRRSTQPVGHIDRSCVFLWREVTRAAGSWFRRRTSTAATSHTRCRFRATTLLARALQCLIQIYAGRHFESDAHGFSCDFNGKQTRQLLLAAGTTCSQMTRCLACSLGPTSVPTAIPVTLYFHI